MEEKDLVQREKASLVPSKVQIICDTVWLSVTSAVLLAVFITSGLSNDTRFGFRNGTGEVSDIYFTQVCSSLIRYKTLLGLHIVTDNYINLYVTELARITLENLHT